MLRCPPCCEGRGRRGSFVCERVLCVAAKNCAECVNYQQDVLIAWSWDGVVVPVGRKS